MKGCYYLFAAFLAASTFVSSSNAQNLADATLPLNPSSDLSDQSGFTSRGEDPNPGAWRRITLDGFIILAKDNNFAAIAIDGSPPNLSPAQYDDVMAGKKSSFTKKIVAAVAVRNGDIIRVGAGSKQARSVANLASANPKRVKSSSELLTFEPGQSSAMIHVVEFNKSHKVATAVAGVAVSSTQGGKVLAFVNSKSGSAIIAFFDQNGINHVMSSEGLGDAIGRLRHLFGSEFRVATLFKK